MLLANAGYYMWWGGAATGPRHLVAVIPFLAVGVAEMLTERRWHAAVVAVASLSVASMLAFTAVGLEAPEGVDAWTHYAGYALRGSALTREMPA